MINYSIAIISYNGYNRVKHLLKSIYQNTDLTDTEIIVLDDGSMQENRISMLRLFNDYKKLTFIQNETNLGIVKSWNRVCSEAKGKYIALLNDDLIMTPNWLKSAMYFLENNSNVGAVGFPTYFMLESDMPNYFTNNYLLPRCPRTKQLMKPEQYQSNVNELDNPPGACAIVVGCAFCFEKAVWERVGKFDENIKSMFEDYDFGSSLLKFKYQNYMLRSPIIHHILSGTFGSNPQLKGSQVMQESRRYYIKKWGNDVGLVADKMFDEQKTAVKVKFLDSKLNEREEYCGL